MAKGKNLNPADALRKAQRKKELKKNKEQRQKTRDFALVKKDTAELEDEIAELEKLTEPTKAQSSRLSELKAELAKIVKKKEEYVGEHPEQRGLVYRRRRDKEKENDTGGEAQRNDAMAKKTKRNLFNKNGLPRHPERSVYYDPVMNPYGMPPPGMPYAERALLPGEVDSEAEEEAAEASGSDDDIPMPEGPPPGATGSDEENDDDDIPLPEGPPPGAATEEEEDASAPPLPAGPPPLPPGPPPTMPMIPFASNFPPQMVAGQPFFPPPPPLASMAAQPGIPPAFLLHPPPPPPPGFSYPPTSFPPPPPGFFPRRGQQQSASAVQDPLSNIPHQTYQAHRSVRHAGAPLAAPSSSSLPVNPNLPPKPVGVTPANGSASKAVASANATVSAEPELRDFKKESTAFVPSTLKRKKGAGSGRVNAAPSVGMNDNDSAIATSGRNVDGNDGELAVPKPDLLGSLREKFGSVVGAAGAEDGGQTKESAKKRKVEKPKDDYNKFLEEMGGLLGAQ